MRYKKHFVLTTTTVRNDIPQTLYNSDETFHHKNTLTEDMSNVILCTFFYRIQPTINNIALKSDCIFIMITA